MRIIFFSRLFYPHIGGVEKHVFEVSRLLVKKGNSVTVLTEYYNHQLKSEDKIEGIKIIRINNGKDNWFKKFRVWKNLWKFRELIKRSDIIHAHDVFFWYLPFRFLYPSKKIFTTFHGYEGFFPISKKAILNKKIAKWLSAGTIGVGKYIEKWYKIKLDYITYGGINSRFFENKTKIKTKNKIILFIGRLEGDTGLDTYMEALKILKKKGEMFTFYAVGDGYLKSRVKKFGKVLGFVKNPQKYIQAADIVFASSYLSIMESLALGKYIISAFNNPLKKDYLMLSPMKSLIISESSPYRISDKIIKYFRNNRIDVKRDAWVKGQTWDKVLQIYLNLWKKQ